MLSRPPVICYFHDHESRTLRVVKAFISKSTIRSITRIHFNMPVALWDNLYPVSFPKAIIIQESLFPWIIMILTICQILKKSSAIQELCFQYGVREGDTLQYYHLPSSKEDKFVMENNFKIQKFVSHAPISRYVDALLTIGRQIEDLPAIADVVTWQAGQTTMTPALDKFNEALEKWSDFIPQSPKEDQSERMCV